MSIFNQGIIDIIGAYADKLHLDNVKAIITRNTIESDQEALLLVDFSEQMIDLASKYQLDGHNILGSPAMVYDAEKSYLALHEFISSQGYEKYID